MPGSWLLKKTRKNLYSAFINLLNWGAVSSALEHCLLNNSSSELTTGCAECPFKWKSNLPVKISFHIIQPDLRKNTCENNPENRKQRIMFMIVFSFMFFRWQIMKARVNFLSKICMLSVIYIVLNYSVFLGQLKGITIFLYVEENGKLN